MPVNGEEMDREVRYSTASQHSGSSVEKTLDQIRMRIGTGERNTLILALALLANAIFDFIALVVR